MSSSFHAVSSLLTSAAVLSALAFAPGCSSGDVPIGQDGTSTRNGSGSGEQDAGTGGGGGGGEGDASSPADGGGAADAGGPSCTADSDCASNARCLYLIADECSAKAQCVALQPEPACTLVVNSCACDGTNVDTGCTIYPEQYAPKPIATPGVACGRAADGGPLPSSCSTSADCENGEVCGFKETDACSAAGTCLVPSGGAECNSVVPACACDDTIVNTICNGLQDGYAPKAVLYPLQSTCPPK